MPAFILLDVRSSSAPVREVANISLGNFASISGSTFRNSCAEVLGQGRGAGEGGVALTTKVTGQTKVA